MALTDMQQIILVNEDNIPHEFKQLRQWVLWRGIYNDETSKIDKIPFQANGRKAKANDSSTWTDFETVLQVYNEGDQQGTDYEGIGFVLTKEDGYLCVDIDNLTDVDNLDDLATEITNMSYAELSVSGTGIHVWFKANFDKTRHKNKNASTGYEAYETGRFITFTGETINDLPINDGGEQLNHFLDKVLKRDVAITVNNNLSRFGQSELSSDQIIRQALASKKSERFYKFLFGGWEGDYNHDHSAADMAFLNDLAFWCNRDPYRMDEIFRKSNLMRDKWDRPQNNSTYGVEQIQKAISEFTGEGYTQKIKGNEVHKKWWRSNGNGTLSFLHQVLAEEVLKEFSIVRYPSPHSDLYYYNPKKGIYEQDKSGRQIAGVIRRFDNELKASQVREVQSYIQDLSPVIRDVSENHIAFNNGLFNFSTFESESFTPKVFVLQKISVNYNPEAYDPFVDSTIQKVTKNHIPSIRNIEEMFAAVLYPGVIIPKIFYLYGKSAANGKSSILNMIHRTFNRDGTSISAVTPQKLANNNFAGASIYGKLSNIVDDLPEQVIEDSGTLKSITTGGYIEIEKKGRDSETVKVSTCMIIASNHLPNFSESGNSINRRMHIIPFEHNFLKDKDCLSDLETQRLIESESAREYVLKLAVDALKRMLNNPSPDKLTQNDKSDDLGQTFAEHNDPWIDYFHEYDVEYFEQCQGTTVMKDYEDWCRDNRVIPLNARGFKELVCSRLDMEWKTKKITINHTPKSVKGFKRKTSSFKLG